MLILCFALYASSALAGGYGKPSPTPSPRPQPTPTPSTKLTPAGMPASEYFATIAQLNLGRVGIEC